MLYILFHAYINRLNDILYPLSYDVIDLEYLIQIYLPLDLAFSLYSCSQSGTVYDT